MRKLENTMNSLCLPHYQPCRDLTHPPPPPTTQYTDPSNENSTYHQPSTSSSHIDVRSEITPRLSTLTVNNNNLYFVLSVHT